MYKNVDFILRNDLLKYVWFYFLFLQPVGIYPKKYEWAGTPIGLQGHIGNDCSLWVRSATLDFDDGFWECQVTASDFTAQDALTSQPIRLVVRGNYMLMNNFSQPQIFNNNQ